MSLLSLVGMKWRPPADQVVPRLATGTKVILVREPENTHDPNAIAVYLHLGYIAKRQVEELGPAIDDAKLALAMNNEAIVKQLRPDERDAFEIGVRTASTGRLEGTLIQTNSGWPCIDINPDDKTNDHTSSDPKSALPKNDDDIPF